MWRMISHTLPQTNYNRVWRWHHPHHSLEVVVFIATVLVAWCWYLGILKKLYYCWGLFKLLGCVGAVTEQIGSRKHTCHYKGLYLLHTECDNECVHQKITVTISSGAWYWTMPWVICNRRIILSTMLVLPLLGHWVQSIVSIQKLFSQWSLAFRKGHCQVSLLLHNGCF